MIRTLWTVLLLSLAWVFAADASAADFFVAPDGNDANPGTEREPFATLGRARDTVREKIAAGLKADVTVVVRGGTYRLDEPVAFGPEDGGTERFGITYRAAKDERPVFSGGRAITGWKATPGGACTAEIPDVKAGKWTFRELFVNGHRALAARLPDQGYLRVEKVGADRKTNFVYKAGDLTAYADLEQVELVFLHDWSITRAPVRSIDDKTRTLSVVEQVGGPGRWCRMDWFEKQPRYYLENSAAFLDRPGEWFLDRKAGVLTYLPRPGEEIGKIDAVAPVARQLLVVRGDLEKGRPVRNLRFVGLAFEHAAWSPPGGIYWGRQACTYWSPETIKAGRNHEEADPAAVQFDGTEGCSFENGRVCHVGRSAVWFGRQCRDNVLQGNIISDAGGNGVMIGEGKARVIGGKTWWETMPQEAATGNTVSNNVVEKSGQELFGAVGIWVGLAAKTTIAHNEVRDHPYTGVSVGWMWWNPRDRPEPRNTPARENVVAANHIHHTMLTLSDGGCIYTLGTQPGSELRGNHIHDVSANAGRAESNGMFLDQGTGEFTIRGNTIYNIARSPLRFHKGWKNLVKDNVLEVGKDIPTVRYNDTKAERIRMEDNNILEKISAKAIAEAQQRAGLEPAYRRMLEGRKRD